MSVTETTTQSWGSRLGGAFKGILAGIGLVLAAIVLLFWNEGNSVKTADSLRECQKVTISIPSDKLDAQNNGKPIHTTGKALVNGEINDPLFPAVKIKAISLSRKVEMYQWQEESHTNTQKNTGGSTTTTTTYTYKTTWSDSLIPSSAFKEAGHNNPAQMAVEAAQFDAAEVTLGAFRLPVDRARSLPSKPFTPDVPNAAAQPAAVAQPVAGQPGAQAVNGQVVAAPVAGQAIVAQPANGQVVVQGQAVPGQVVQGQQAQPQQTVTMTNPNGTVQTIVVPATPAPVPGTVVANALPAVLPAGALVINNRIFLYTGGYWYSSIVNPLAPNPAAPQIGDIRISHSYVPEQEASVVAVQQDGSFAPFTAKNGYTMFLVHSGIKTMDQMFAAALSANSTMTWLIRLLGFVLMFVGFKMIFAPLEVLADVLPFLGNLVGYGTGFIAFILAAGLSLLTIGIAWVFYRPLLGIALLVIGVGLIVYLFKGRGQKAAPAPTNDVPPAPQA